MLLNNSQVIEFLNKMEQARNASPVANNAILFDSDFADFVKSVKNNIDILQKKHCNYKNTTVIEMSSDEMKSYEQFKLFQQFTKQQQ